MSGLASSVRQRVSGALVPLRAEWQGLLAYASTIALWTCKFYALLAVVIGWLLSLACSSFITYLLFYNWMMPTYRATLPVHFDVSGASSPLLHPHATVSLRSERQWQLTDVASLVAANSAASSTAATTPTAGGGSGGVLTGSSAPTSNKHLSTSSSSRFLTPGHAYHLYLELDFPDSVANQECGMQSVEMLALHDGLLLASSLHAFTPHYSSPLVRWMWSWAWALPLVTGFLQEKQTVSLHMFDQFVENEQFPITSIRVLLKSPSAPRFQLYSAQLRVQVQLFGLRWLMYHWWLSTGVVMTSCIFAFQVFWSAVIVGVVCLWFFSGGTSSALKEQQRIEEEEEALQAAADKLVAEAERDAAKHAALLEAEAASDADAHYYALEDEEEDEAAAAAATSAAAEGKPRSRKHWQGDARRAASSGVPALHSGQRHSSQSRPLSVSSAHHLLPPMTYATAASTAVAGGSSLPRHPGTPSVKRERDDDEAQFERSELYGALSTEEAASQRAPSAVASVAAASPSPLAADDERAVKSEPGLAPVEGMQQQVQLRHRNVQREGHASASHDSAS
jgi:hypothetical protein